eukprot:TRINITY_DN1180_c0_g2_i1.p1 TRINITY_DN1180_c0_g2~~TRINITY_DN1180_c0_g2_i1.p1  ORF type:complete len:699 (-),score=121.66 TRINITY_DN1180_c0_g2_i1:59-1939(-)
MDLALSLCIQIGHALDFYDLISEAASDSLSNHTPLIYSTLLAIATHAPQTVPKNGHLAQLERVAGRVGALGRGRGAGPELVAMLLELGAVGDATWALLPVMFGAFFGSSIWSKAAFDVSLGGFTNNIHCLARCIHHLLEGTEVAGAERRELKKELLAQQRASRGTQGQGSAASGVATGGDTWGVDASEMERAVRGKMRTVVQVGTCFALAEAWAGIKNRGPLFSQVLFFDHLCSLSRYLPRNTLSAFLPDTLLLAALVAYYRERQLSTQHLGSGLGIGRDQGPIAAQHLANRGVFEKTSTPSEMEKDLSELFDDDMGDDPLPPHDPSTSTSTHASRQSFMAFATDFVGSRSSGPPKYASAPFQRSPPVVPSSTENAGPRKSGPPKYTSAPFQRSSSVHRPPVRTRSGSALSVMDNSSSEVAESGSPVADETAPSSSSLPLPSPAEVGASMASCNNILPTNLLPQASLSRVPSFLSARSTTSSSFAFPRKSLVRGLSLGGGGSGSSSLRSSMGTFWSSDAKAAAMEAAEKRARSKSKGGWLAPLPTPEAKQKQNVERFLDWGATEAAPDAEPGRAVSGHKGKGIGTRGGHNNEIAEEMSESGDEEGDYRERNRYGQGREEREQIVVR